MSPEYTTGGTFSVKSDVYSFGVLLLEIISGKRNSGNNLYGDFDNLLEYVCTHCKIYLLGQLNMAFDVC